MRSKVVGIISLLGIILLLMIPSVFGQQIGASVTGHVDDPSGAAVAGATITARQTATGTVFRTETNGLGLYYIPFVPVGPYTITVEKSGFKEIARSGITLTVAQKARIDFKLELGAVTQTVSVTANASLLQTESGGQNYTIDSHMISELPLRGMNVFQDTWTLPGVTMTDQLGNFTVYATGASEAEDITGGFSTGGGQNGWEGEPNNVANMDLVDGVPNMMEANGVGYIPISDSVQEVKVENTMFDAEYGWSTGGVVNIITKGGTNQWHGDAYEYLQNTSLNANSWANNRVGVPRQPWHVNIFGGSVGGPIKRNKLFAFFAYQGYRQISPDPFITTVPTAAEHDGDFSQDYVAPGMLQTIYDPLTTVCNAGTCTRTAFAGNIIPPSRINPVAKNVLALIPLGNTSGSPLTHEGNLVSTSNSRKKLDSMPAYSGRIDYNLSDKTHAFFRYSWNMLSESRYFRYSTLSHADVADTTHNAPFNRGNDDFTLQVTHIFNPTTILEVRTGMDRFISINSRRMLGTAPSLTSLGFSPTFVSEAAQDFPIFNFSGYNGAGNGGIGANPIDMTYANNVVLAKSYNRQNLKFGFQNIEVGANYETPGDYAGNFSFTGAFTQNTPIGALSSTGNSIADFLLGYPSSGDIQVNAAPALMEHLNSLFAQDDIRASRKLTLNVGLRWDYLGPMTDRFNAINSGFCFTCASPLQIPGMNLQGGLEFAGVGGNSRGEIKPHYGNFGPRFGFAYQVRHNTVIRGGYGMIYGQIIPEMGGAAPGFSQTTAMVTSIQEGIPYNTLTNPFPNGILRPVGSGDGLATGLGQGISFADPDYNIPRVQQYSLDVQHTFGMNWMLSAAYVGSRTSRLPVNKYPNALPLSALALGTSVLTSSVPNPFLAASSIPADAPYLSLLQGTSLAGSTVLESQLLKPYPQFGGGPGNYGALGGITEEYVPVGKSNFNSLQVDVNKRMSAGIDLDGNFTWEKTMWALAYLNPTDPAPAWTIGNYDEPEQVKFSAVWDLPFGPGMRFGHSTSPLVSRLTGGWFASPVFMWSRGTPLPFPNGVAPTGYTQSVPNQSINRLWFNPCTLELNGSTRNCQPGEKPAWVVRQTFQLMTWSPYISQIREPNLVNLDLSIGKTTHIKERYTLKFRADFLNATNTPTWFTNGPDENPGDSLFGQIVNYNDPNNNPRMVMLSLRFQF